MERNYHKTSSSWINADEMDYRTAFHEAGHAAAIHIRNQQKQLPPIFFEIHIRKPQYSGEHFFAKVIDGNLIQNLPMAVLDGFYTTAGDERHSCRLAYEADIVNLLAGPLAEAKYISIRDNEVFNPNIINLPALRNYGGLSDLERVQTYLECFITTNPLREQKILELLEQAFLFVNNCRYWRGISALAQYILDSQLQTINCDEAINIMDKALSTYPLGVMRQLEFANIVCH